MRVHDRELDPDTETLAWYGNDSSFYVDDYCWVDAIHCAECDVNTPIVVIKYVGSGDAICKKCHKVFVYRPWYEW